MQCSLNCEYTYEDMHKCNYCNHFIESKFCKVIWKSTRLFYHPICFDILRKKLDLIYS